VRERPADLRDSDVAAALARQWALTVQELSYLPVGFGGYHWLAVDQAGSRWFVTVSDLAAPWVPDLPAAMQTAAWLATEAGLEFVVAPVPTSVGQVVGSLDSQHALTLFPYLDVAPSSFEDPIDDGDRAAIIDLLARLHTAAPKGFQVPTRPLELANRQAIHDALASLDAPWRGGPYSEPGRDLLARYERPLLRAFARFDGLLDRVREAGGPYVITHGEPHPGNLLRTRAGLRLVDWDMIALARPERDLWWVISSDRDVDRYWQRTRWTVNQDALALYRLRWSLDDIAEFLSEIRGPHEETADTLVSWTALQETLEAAAKGLKHLKGGQRPFAFYAPIGDRAGSVLYVLLGRIQAM
jgi:spectinomycin phosphotransferase